MKMRVPIKDLAAQTVAIRTELIKAVEEVLDSGQFVLGPQVDELEATIARYCGVRHAVGVSSGTDALLVALMALEVGPGDLVATSTFSFFATAGVIARLGARPVFVDIDPDTYNMNVRDLRRRLEALSPEEVVRVRAIIPVHLYGQCADIEPILAVAAAYRVPVVEDAAQALGAQYRDGRTAGSLGAIGCFSFFPTKSLGAVGDAGMVVTNDADAADRVRRLRTHGSYPKYFHSIVGGNFRLDTLQAAILLVKLKYLDDWVGRCQERAERYTELFARHQLLSRVTLPTVRHCGVGQPRAHVFHQYVVRVSRRDELRRFLQQRGIGSEVYYPLPLHLQECFEKLGYRRGDFPVAERAAEETLALPMYPELSDQQQASVVRAIADFCEEAR